MTLMTLIMAYDMKFLERVAQLAAQAAGEGHTLEIPANDAAELAKTLTEIIEDLEDEEELRRAKGEEDKLIPWEQVKAEYWAEHSDAEI
jgi:hypothetical protein